MPARRGRRLHGIGCKGGAKPTCQARELCSCFRPANLLQAAAGELGAQAKHEGSSERKTL
jgi:hypothetical protein